MNGCGYSIRQRANKTFIGCMHNTVQQFRQPLGSPHGVQVEAWKGKNLMECPCQRGTVPVFTACSTPATACGCTNILMNFSMALNKALFLQHHLLSK